MKAILIDVEFNTGNRPKSVLNEQGKIKEDLWCGNRWQNLDAGKEIRIIKSGDIQPYQDQKGIIILENQEEIEGALSEYIPIKIEYSISNEIIMDAHIKSSNIDFEKLPQEADKSEELEFLYDAGIRGIDKKIISPQDPSELILLL